MKSSCKFSSAVFSKSDEEIRRLERVKSKLHALEKNISALCDSEMDRDHKRFVLAVLYDYKTELMARLNHGDSDLH